MNNDYFVRSVLHRLEHWVFQSFMAQSAQLNFVTSHLPLLLRKIKTTQPEIAYLLSAPKDIPKPPMRKHKKSTVQAISGR